jgi:iron complex transport system substrate-binding protein
MRRALLLAVLLGSCTPAAGPGQARLSGIASINPCTDAILAEVADPARIAALSSWSSRPASSSMDVGLARRFAATTGTAEELVALRPAMVLGGTFTSPATRAALDRLAIPLTEMPIAHTVAQSEDQVRAIAHIAGHPERGEALVGRIEQALMKARPLSAGRPTALVWQGGGIVAGADSLLGDLLARTGFTSYAARHRLKQADYLPLEKVLADPPDVLITVTADGEAQDRLRSHPALAAIHSTRATLDGNLLWCGGPTIARAAARVAAIRRGMPH